MVTPRKSSKGTTTVKKTRATATDQSRPRPTYDDVARRAYELYVARGGTHGRDWDDWLSAERQLLSLEG
jgi:hypothetical protein